MREGRRGKAISSPRGGPHDIFCVGFFFLFYSDCRTKAVAAALEGKSIKIPLRSLGEYSAGIIVQFARITRISRVFLPRHAKWLALPGKKRTLFSVCTN